MASKASAPIAFLLSLNLLFFTLVTSQTTPTPAPPPSACPQARISFPCLRIVRVPVLGILTLAVEVGDANQCCSVIPGVLQTNLEVALCLCQQIQINNLPLVRNIFRPSLAIAVAVITSTCRNGTLPSNFTCPLPPAP